MPRTNIARRATAVAVAALAVLGLAAAACGSTNTADPTPVRQFKITPAPATFTAGAPTAAVTGEATPADASTPATGEPSGGATTIELVGRDTLFDKTKLAAPAGSVLIKFSNKDGGVVHNVHVHKGKDAKGESIGDTGLKAGPIEQELTLDLTAGEYFLVCDAHPATMHAALTVS